MTKTFLLATAFVALSTGVGCGPNHIQPFTPRHRSYEVGKYAQKDPAAKPTNGSLYSDGSPGFLEDTRAVRVGDFVSVRIDESADASGNASTKLGQESTGSTGVNALLGIVPALKSAYPGMDPSKLLEYASKSGFAGTGGTSRKGELKGSIAVRVVREMPNGDLFIEGTKVVMINNEEYHLYVSGLVRPADITQDNTVPSSRIADAQVEFTGRGDVAAQQRKGWFSRFLEWINPF
jgi:flagellar L-ring protein precursor FlgH